MKKKSAFTLVELLIVIGILGVVAAATIPLLQQRKPDQNRVMAKKAYMITSQIVEEMINDTSLYPEINSAGNECVGFDNIDAANGCSGATKFGCLFRTYLNGEADGNDWITSDGMKWTIDGRRITVDVVPSGSGNHSFSMTVANDGVITVNTNWAIDAIKLGQTNHLD